jgi:hypothetical protein
MIAKTYSIKEGFVALKTPWIEGSYSNVGVSLTNSSSFCYRLNYD